MAGMLKNHVVLLLLFLANVSNLFHVVALPRSYICRHNILPAVYLRLIVARMRSITSRIFYASAAA